MSDVIFGGIILIVLNTGIMYLVVKAAILDAIRKSGLLDVLKIMHDEQSNQTIEIVSKLDESRKH